MYPVVPLINHSTLFHGNGHRKNVAVLHDHTVMDICRAMNSCSLLSWSVQNTNK